MVRINVGVNPRYLHDKHLGAEYNEILKLCGHVRAHPTPCKKPWPTEYTLGKGHINFFKDKLVYLHRRWEAVCTECERRGRYTDRSKFHKNLQGVDNCTLIQLANDWQPRQRDFELVKARIIQRCQQYGFPYSDLQSQVRTRGV